MNEVTTILSKIQCGDGKAAEELLPLVYDELRKLAANKLAKERLDHSLQATGLVHEAYARLVDTEIIKAWNSRGHFFGAAAEAMRRILVEHARRKSAQKRGGGIRHENFDDQFVVIHRADELLALDDALELLQAHDPAKAELVKLRFFAGLTVKETAQALGISVTTADRHWTYARAWLQREMSRS